MSYKLITHAFPHSQEAINRGFEKTGCYTLALVKRNVLFYSDNEAQKIVSKATKQEILRDASEFDIPWSDFSLFDHRGKSIADRILSTTN